MRVWLLSSNCPSALGQRVRAYGEMALSRRGGEAGRGRAWGVAKESCPHSVGILRLRSDMVNLNNLSHQLFWFLQRLFHLRTNP